MFDQIAPTAGFEQKSACVLALENLGGGNGLQHLTPVTASALFGAILVFRC